MLEYADIPRNCSSLFFRARSAEPRDRRNMNRSRTFGMLGRKFVFTPALILFPFAWVYASAQISEPAHRSNIDKTSLETYLRHLQLIVPEAVMDISDGVPSSKIPGFFEVRVQISYNGDLS